MRAPRVGALLIVTLALLGAAARGEELLVRGATILTGAGEIIEGGSILLAGGKVKAIGRDLQAGEGVRVIEAGGKLVCPGFIDAHSHLGLRPAEMNEIVLPASGRTSPLAAFSPQCDAAVQSLAAGVTSVVLAPGYANPLAGPSVLVSLGSDPPAARPVAIALSLSTEALLGDRKPTSLPGLIETVRAALGEAKASGKEDDPLAQAARGGLTIQAYCDGAASVEQALALAKEFGLRGAVLVPSAPLRLPEILAGSGLAVLLPPLGETPEDRRLTMAARLAAANVPFAFTSMAIGDEISDVRASAALAVGAGLAPDAALRALTLGAAEALGVADRIGSLEVGKDADLLIIGGHPLDLAAPIECVVARGAIVYERRKG